MRTIKINIDNDIFDGLEKLKKKTKLTWEQFIIKSVWNKYIINSVEIDKEKNGRN